MNIMAYDVRQRYLIDDIKTAKFFTILAVEVESHHVELFLFCMRYVDDKKNICEVLLEFGKSTRVTDEAIAYQIINI